MLKTLTAERGAFIQISGDAEPKLLADLDGARVEGRSHAMSSPSGKRWSATVS